MYGVVVECDTVVRIHFLVRYVEFVLVGINIREWFLVCFKIYSVNI